MTRTSLISPMIDFWLIGGLSLLTLLVTWLVTDFVFPAQMSTLQFKMGWMAFYVAFFINLPHFSYSYQLFYSNYVERLRDPAVAWQAKARIFTAGVIVPIIMLDYFAVAYATESAQMLGWGVSAMFLTVGWHYVKQGYGVLITLSLYKKVFYSPWEKRILLVNAYAVWLYALLKINSVVYQHHYYDVPYMTFGLPAWLVTVTGAMAIIMGVLSIAVFIRRWITGKRDVPINAIIGYVASSYLWVAFPYINPIYFLFVPMFHSLQYMPFVFRYKIGEAKEKAPHQNKIWQWIQSPIGFGLIGIILGGAFMHFIPAAIDKAHNDTHGFFTQNFFLVSMLLFINIHHYFIDSSFWRRDNKRVQDFLFHAK